MARNRARTSIFNRTLLITLVFGTLSCFLPGCNETLRGLGGSFHSPNHPNNYPNGQFCSWRIIVSPGQQIHVIFRNFTLQNEIKTDSLLVYDGENATAKEMGIFYGGYPPPEEGLYSTSSEMFLVFKSDKISSFSGFSAIYCEGNCSGKSSCDRSCKHPLCNISHDEMP